MKVFISWSGQVSHEVALALREWLPVVLPYARALGVVGGHSEGSAMGNGTRGATGDATNCGILCITSENAHEAWLNFEAGALSKTVAQAQVHPFLLGLRPSDLAGPLAQFQMTEFERADVAKLARALNDTAGAQRLSQERLEQNFQDVLADSRSIPS